MISVFVLIFIAFILGLAAWLIFVWAVKSGQYDDAEGPKYRMLEDDEEKKNEDDNHEDGDSQA